MTLTRARHAAIIEGPPRRTLVSFAEPLSPFGSIGPVIGNTPAELALAAQCIDRHAHDADDAALLRRVLGTGGGE